VENAPSKSSEWRQARGNQLVGGNLARHSWNVLAINRDHRWVKISRWADWWWYQVGIYPRSDNLLANMLSSIEARRHFDYSNCIDLPRDCITKRLHARDWLCYTPLDTINMDRCRDRKLANQSISNWSPGVHHWTPCSRAFVRTCARRRVPRQVFSPVTWW